MIAPKFERGQWVVSTADLYNDGSHPDAEDGALLVAASSLGEIVRTGLHAASGTPLYVVAFPGAAIVGCLEEEIALSEQEATP